MSAKKVCKDCGKPGIKGNPLNKDGIHASAYDCVEHLKDRCWKLKEEAEEYDHSFNIRWRADMRAIKRWQEAHPGNDLVWPDHADLVVWLLEQLELKMKKAKRKSVKKRSPDLSKKRFDFPLKLPGKVCMFYLEVSRLSGVSMNDAMNVTLAMHVLKQGDFK